MPVYKPMFLRAAINSILTQTMRDFELILVNDGSPYPQVQSIGEDAKCRDSRVRYVEQRNQGLAVARNTGAAAAKAPYLMWMDDDDISLPDRMQQQWTFLQKMPDVAAVNCAHRGINNDGEINRNYNKGNPAPMWADTIVQIIPPPVSDAEMITVGPAIMIRKSAFDAVGGMRPFFRICEDTDFVHRLEEKYSLAFIPEVLFHYRYNSSAQQLSRNKNFYLYYYAAKIAAYSRRCGNGDPVEEGKKINDIIRLLPSLPPALRQGFIRLWTKEMRKNLSCYSRAELREAFVYYRKLLSADIKLINRASRKIAMIAFFRGYWHKLIF